MEGGVGTEGEVTMGELLAKRSNPEIGAWHRGIESGGIMCREAKVGRFGVLASSSSSSGKGALDDANEESLDALILESVVRVLVAECTRDMR